MLSKANPNVVGHVLIRDKLTGEILVDKKNAIHYEHMSIAIAKSLSREIDGFISEMAFGNGASTVTGTGTVTYFPPRVTGPDADLYNQTYSKVVDDKDPRNLDATQNKVEVRHVNNTLYTDIIVTATLDYDEPNGQDAFDDALNVEGNFVFDEIALKTYSLSLGEGTLLTHVIFNPVQKSLNRLIEIVYTLRITMV